jgi:hypothetical protein
VLKILWLREDEEIISLKRPPKLMKLLTQLKDDLCILFQIFLYNIKIKSIKPSKIMSISKQKFLSRRKYNKFTAVSAPDYYELAAQKENG